MIFPFYHPRTSTWQKDWACTHTKGDSCSPFILVSPNITHSLDYILCQFQTVILSINNCSGCTPKFSFHHHSAVWRTSSWRAEQFIQQMVSLKRFLLEGSDGLKIVLHPPHYRTLEANAEVSSHLVKPSDVCISSYYFSVNTKCKAVAFALNREQHRESQTQGAY